MLLSQGDRDKIAWLAEETDRIPDEGVWAEGESMLMFKLWKDFKANETRLAELEAEHGECVQIKASLGLYLQHLRASAKAASNGYVVGSEAKMLEAVVADLERAMIGHWPIPHTEVVESLVAEVEERDLPE